MIEHELAAIEQGPEHIRKGLLGIVIWAALVFWTYADARRRIDDPMLIGCATAASLFPFVGTIVYAIVRPPEFLDDVRLRELEHVRKES